MELHDVRGLRMLHDRRKMFMLKMGSKRGENVARVHANAARLILYS